MLFIVLVYLWWSAGRMDEQVISLTKTLSAQHELDQNAVVNDDMPATPSTVSFTVRRPTPASRPSSSGPESDSSFKVPALPRHLASAGGSSATGSPLAGSPRTFSSRDDSDDDGETGIVFANGSDGDSDGHHTDSSEEDHFIAGSTRPSGQRCVVRIWSSNFIEVDSQKLSRLTWHSHSSLHKKKKKASDQEAPLVIPSRPNPDWREAARKRRAASARIQSHTHVPSFIPPSARASTGADGSVGGLGTRDTINSGAQLSGLQIPKRVDKEDEEDDAATAEAASTVSVEQSTVEVIEETEDQMALRALLAGEVSELPDAATVDDYERIPISAFGAAMLRGMGWTEGPVAPKSDKRSKNALSELYLPQARPAMLGIGAKEWVQEDAGSGKKKSKGRDMRYIPVARKESQGGENGSSRSGTVSRRSSRSPSRRERGDRVPDWERSPYDDRDRRKDRDRDRDRDRGDDRRRRTKNNDDRDQERRDYKDRDQDRDVERDHDRDRDDRYQSREREGKGKQYDQRDRPRERDRRDR